MNRMSGITLAFALLAAGPESAQAFKDLARFPPHEQQHYAYLSLSSVPEDQRDKLENVLRFVVPSLAHGSYLEDQIPVRVPGTNLLRLNLEGLDWPPEVYRDVLIAQYVPKYRPDLLKCKHCGKAHAPLVADGHWFAANMLDGNETKDAQYQLLYSGKPPANVDEFLKFWGIQNDAEYVFGIIETNSGVAEELVRLMENRPGAKRNECWLTRDSRVVAGAFDPLENLPNKAKFDAQELIVTVPKWYAGKSGVLQAYLLAGADGKRQEVAPTAIVVDHTNVRGVEIANSSSCIYCHVEGIRDPTYRKDDAGQVLGTLDGFRQYIDNGGRLYVKDKNLQEAIDRYHGSDVAKQVKAGQQAYGDGVNLCNGLSAAQNAQAFIEVVKAYDKPLALADVARHYFCTPEELRFALGHYSRLYNLPARLVVLTEGGTITRPQLYENADDIQEVMRTWHATH